MRSLFLACVLPLALLLGACGSVSAPADNRTKLAQTEIAATAAFREVTTLANAGIIRKGSQTAVIIADAELVLAAAIRVWRTDPDNPKYIEAGMAALGPLLSLITNAKAGKSALIFYIPAGAPLAHRFA